MNERLHFTEEQQKSLETMKQVITEHLEGKQFRVMVFSRTSGGFGILNGSFWSTDVNDKILANWLISDKFDHVQLKERK